MAFRPTVVTVSPPSGSRLYRSILPVETTHALLPSALAKTGYWSTAPAGEIAGLQNVDRPLHPLPLPLSRRNAPVQLTDRPICSSRRFALAWSPSSAAVACCVSIQSTLGKAACDSLRLIGDNNLLTLYPQLAHRAAPRDPKTRRRDPHFPKGAYISSVCLSPSLTGSADDEGALVAI
ncbi:hypothetical protein DTO027B5_7757 [Paecilomyces variotii]|nr:hypothetical protein DTO169C6_8676 [Paecilomyces variotii]KAJ9321143.1 hypothetical protein DTO027B3_7899 [Paecilomyces variotii]KAJ9330451.1 hypothetical protein DTO027B5_7757 [Paecilomyces variotii]KAJ9358593.1 hypothetical protein DTO027B9_2266 [Paecilomyces variotii]